MIQRVLPYEGLLHEVVEHNGVLYIGGIVPEDTSLDIESYLGPINADLSGWDMQGWELHSSEPVRPRMNWKLVIDTFLELYHFRYLHGASVAPLIPLPTVTGPFRH